MDTETINTLRTLFEEYANKDTVTVTAAYLTVGGMLFVSIVGVISQWLITKHVVSEEHKRLTIQLHTESRARQHEKWEENIMGGIMGLLKASDPEINHQTDPAVVTTHVHKIQLLLNTNDPNQYNVHNLVNQLALTANGWHANDDPASLLRMHSQLLEAAKLLIYRPMNHT